MNPRTIPKLSCSTLAIGATQFVVHDALEMMSCRAGSYASSFTPSTIVTSSPVAGAEMTTLLAPASRCLRASAALVNRPVDSTTTSTPSSRHGSPAGSRSASILIVCDPARMASPSTVTSTSSGPSRVSYLSRCANVATSPRSLAATISMPAVLAAPACTARQKLRPIRPNPLMPTRTVTAEFSLIVVLLALAAPPFMPPDRTLPNSGRQHVGGQVRLGPGDAQLHRAPVGQREQPADPPGYRVLSQRGLGQLAELLQARLTVLDAELTRDDQVLGRGAAEDLQGPLHPRAGRHRGPGAAPQVRVVEVREPVRGGPDLAPHPPVLPGEHAVVGTQPGQQRTDRVAIPDHHAVHAADLPGLGVNLQPPCGADHGQRRLGAGAGDLQGHRPARLGQAAVRQEGAAPGGLAVAGGAGNHLPRQPADRPAVSVHETGLAGQVLTVLVHRTTYRLP